MKKPEIRRYEMLVRLNEFGATHEERFPGTTGAGRLFAQLGATVADLQSHIVEQAAGISARRATAAAKNAARDRLRTTMMRLTRAVRIVAAAASGIDAATRLPKSRCDQRLIVAARALTQNDMLRHHLAANNLPTALADDVTPAIDAFDAAAVSYTRATASCAAARVSISTTMAKALVIAEKLDLVIDRQCESDAVLLAEWKSARHISRATGRQSHRQPTATTARVVTWPSAA